MRLGHPVMPDREDVTKLLKLYPKNPRANLKRLPLEK
jgi:hypothetical protein